MNLASFNRGLASAAGIQLLAGTLEITGFESVREVPAEALSRHCASSCSKLDSSYHRAARAALQALVLAFMGRDPSACFSHAFKKPVPSGPEPGGERDTRSRPEFRGHSQ
jgi:hypothetical protein